MQQPLDVADLGDLALEVGVVLADRLLDRLELMNEEVGRVAVVGLGLHEGAARTWRALRG